MILEIINESDNEFALDGEWFRAGSWAEGSSYRILSANSTTCLEFSVGMEGVAAVVWWVDTKEHNVYLSLALTWPRVVSSPTFQCYTGLPPTNLKAELSKAPKLDTAGGSGLFCSWNLTPKGVRLQVQPDAPCFLPVTAADTALELDSLHQEEGNVWLQTRPKDATDGIVRGCNTIGKSLAGGCATAMASPVLGAKQGGALGFVKGLGVGVVGGLGLATVGTACGVAQVGRGILHSAEAHRARKEEKVWNQEKGQWTEVDLCSLERALENDREDEASSASASNGNVGKHVVDTEFYDLLCVQPDASGSEIKKAYYKQARQCHPDKNPGDEAATARFQRLSIVYQVLSDPEARKKYDTEGSAGLQDREVVMDPKTFFSLLFGSERFIPWTGELHIAASLDQFSKATRHQDHGEEFSVGDGENGWALLRQQLKREIQCACHLRDKLERYVYGRDHVGFEEQMRLEAHELARAQFGPQLLVALGDMYQLRAEMYLANELQGRYTLAKRFASTKHRRLRIQHRLLFLRSAADSLLHARKVYRAANTAGRSSGEDTDSEGHDDEQARAIEAAMDAALPSFLGTAWSYVVQDVDDTMKEVSKKLLRDKSVPWQIRIRRAQALQLVGQIFTETGMRADAMQNSENCPAGRSPDERQVEAKAVIQEAFLGAMRER